MNILVALLILTVFQTVLIFLSILWISHLFLKQKEQSENFEDIENFEPKGVSNDYDFNRVTPEEKKTPQQKQEEDLEHSFFN